MIYTKLVVFTKGSVYNKYLNSCNPFKAKESKTRGQCPNGPP